MELSLSGWRDEKFLVRWRTAQGHHLVQEKGRCRRRAATGRNGPDPSGGPRDVALRNGPNSAAYGRHIMPQVERARDQSQGRGSLVAIASSVGDMPKAQRVRWRKVPKQEHRRRLSRWARDDPVLLQEFVFRMCS